MGDKLISLDSCLKLKQLPDHDTLFTLTDEVSSLLEKEPSEYRPLDDNQEAGSLIELQEEIPVIIVPDIHGRPDFIKNILNFKLDSSLGFSSSMTVRKALEKEKIYLVCVGDAIHTELTKERWQSIQVECDNGNFANEPMLEEMQLSLGALCLVMRLKLEFPKNFHFIKGNHENILNITGEGDFSFIKYADEGEDCRNFIESYYGDDILYLIHYYERCLPLVVCSKGANCVISHAEPAAFYLKGEIINGHLSSEVVTGLTWTRNNQVTERTAMFLMKNLLKPEIAEKGFYFAGHRPVAENYALRQGGRFVQLHNPAKQNIAVVIPGQDFDPEINIVSVIKD